MVLTCSSVLSDECNSCISFRMALLNCLERVVCSINSFILFRAIIKSSCNFLTLCGLIALNKLVISLSLPQPSEFEREQALSK